MKSQPSSSPHQFGFIMNTGIVLGLILAIPIGSIGIGIASGLCLSFLGGIIHRQVSA